MTFRTPLAERTPLSALNYTPIDHIEEAEEPLLPHPTPHYRLWENMSKRILCIYTEGYHFTHGDMHRWSDTRVGKTIMDCCHLPRYQHWFKCIFFDMSVCRSERLSNTVATNWMKVMSTWCEDINERENILCFSNCDSCNRCCTIQFHYNYFPILNLTFLLCESCVHNMFN